MSDALIGRTFSHYRILDHLGAGGMGLIYRAEDLRLRRPVALKFLPRELTGDHEARQRFEREAQAASALDHPAICTIYDVDETDDGAIFIAMALYEGETLKSRIARGPLDIDDALDIAARVAAGLARAHGQRIVHRDIKPANLMLTTDGEVKILDFGLAKLTGATGLTHAGFSPGTASYMAPEQVVGDTIDERTDVWALGVVLYEMITGRNPFAREQNAAALAATIAFDAPPLSDVRGDVPPAVSALVRDAMRRDPAARLPSARDFADRIEQIRAGARPPDSARSRRSRQAIVAGLVIVAAVLAVLIRQNRMHAARENAHALLPRIAGLSAAGNWVEARVIASQAARAIPGDTTLARLIREVTDSITIYTDPPGATVRLVRFDNGRAGDTTDAGVTPIINLAVARGDYLARISLDGRATVERVLSSRLRRDVPPAFTGRAFTIVDSIPLLPEADVPADKVFVPGGHYELVSHDAPRDASADLDDFFLDRYEVTNEDYLAFVRAGGYNNRALWKHPFVRDGRPLSWEEGMALLVDRTGLPAPRTWTSRQFPEGQARHPVTGVTWYEAEAYAEFAACSLPTLYQWEKAARNGQRALGEGLIMPWGLDEPARGSLGRADFGGSGTAPVDAFPFGISPFGAYAMAGNVREWTRTEAGDGHIATGGSFSDPAYLFNAIGVYADFFAAADLGFRCARPRDPDAGRDGAGRLDLADRTPVYHPVDEAAFRALLSHYRYDRTDIHAETVETFETPDWTREKISWIGPGGDRILAYLYLPRSAGPPFQTLVFVPGATVFAAQTVASATEWTIGPLIRAGRAVLGIVLDGMVERPRPPDFVPPAPGSVAFRDLVVQHATELRSGIDYIQTRADIDTARIAYVGLSFGAGSRLIFAGVDDRFKAVVFIGGGIDERLQPALPEASNVNFAPYIRVPKLLLNGSTDDEHPWLTRGLPLWNLLREPKQLVLVEGAGHVPPVEARIPAITQFLDRVFGPVRPRTSGD